MTESIEGASTENVEVSESKGRNYDGIPVKCSGCGGLFHELTSKYELSGMLRGSYLRLLPKYMEYGWYDFPHEDNVVGENIICPQCMMPYRAGLVVAQVMAWISANERGNSDYPPFDMGESSFSSSDNSVSGRVLKMSWDGLTQAEIAKECGISIYMVREIQNGRKV